MEGRRNNRLKRELQIFEKNKEDNLHIEVKTPYLWHITFLGAKNSIYEDEKYT